jgi:hypothetical protein
MAAADNPREERNEDKGSRRKIDENTLATEGKESVYLNRRSGL